MSEVKTDKTKEEIKAAAEKNKIRLSFLSDFYMGNSPEKSGKRLLLYFSSVKASDMEKAANLLKKTVLE